MKTYLILADIIEEGPCYTFMVKASNEKQARKKAMKEAKAYYIDDSMNEVSVDEIELHIREVNTLEDVEATLLA